MKRDNFVDNLKFALDLLGWSSEQLADRLDDKYSVEYLKSVCEGRPFGEVARDVVSVLFYGLADKLECSIIESDISDSEKAGRAAREAFVQVVIRFDLHLREITRLAELACSRLESAEAFRTQTVEIFDVDFWDSVLGNIARELSQGKLFESDQSDDRDTEGLLLLPYNSTQLGQTIDKQGVTNYYVTPPSECWHCHQPTDELTTTKCHCGMNWNIAD